MKKLKFIAQFFKWVKNLLSKLGDLADESVKTGVKVTQSIKKLAQSEIAGSLLDVIKLALPDAGDEIVNKIFNSATETLPRLAIQLGIINSQKDEPTEEKLKKFFKEIVHSDDATWDKYWSMISQEFIVFISDGKINWPESGVLSKIWYDSNLK